MQGVKCGPNKATEDQTFMKTNNNRFFVHISINPRRKQVPIRQLELGLGSFFLLMICTSYYMH